MADLTGEWTRIKYDGNDFSQEMHHGMTQKEAFDKLEKEPRFILVKEVWDSLLHLLRDNKDPNGAETRRNWAIDAMKNKTKQGKLKYEKNIRVVRYVPGSETKVDGELHKRLPHTKGVFAFRISFKAFAKDDISQIDAQAESYFFKDPKEGEEDDPRWRYFGTMSGWFFNIPGYPVPEGFGEMTYEHYHFEKCEF